MKLEDEYIIHAHISINIHVYLNDISSFYFDNFQEKKSIHFMLSQVATKNANEFSH